MLSSSSAETEITSVGRPVHGPTPPGAGRPCSRSVPLQPEERSEVIELIAGGRLSHSAVELPERLRTRDWGSVLEVMLGLDERLGWPRAGWKIGAASEEVRRIEQMPTPSPGRLYLDRIFASPARLDPRLFINYREAECEFAFRLATALPPREREYAEEEVALAVESVFPVLEIGDMVFADWYQASGYYGSSLDNGGSGALVCGRTISGWQQCDLSRAAMEISLNGQPVKSGLGQAAMGHPLTSLTWMANWARQRGLGLGAGEIVSTGTCTGHCFAAEDDLVRADFGPLGEVEFSLAGPGN